MSARTARTSTPADGPVAASPTTAFIGRLDDLAMRAYEDQCAPADPRMPMLDDMEDLMTAPYYGTSLQDVRSRRTASGEAAQAAQEAVPAP